MFWIFLRKLEGGRQFIEGEDSEDEDWIAILYCNGNYLYKREPRQIVSKRTKLSFPFSFCFGETSAIFYCKNSSCNFLLFERKKISHHGR